MLHTFFITIFQEKFFTTLPSSFVPRYSSFLPLFRRYTPPPPPPGAGGGGGRWATHQEHIPSCPPISLAASPHIKPYFIYATKLVLIQHFIPHFVMFHVKRGMFPAFPQ